MRNLPLVDTIVEAVKREFQNVHVIKLTGAADDVPDILILAHLLCHDRGKYMPTALLVEVLPDFEGPSRIGGENHQKIQRAGGAIMMTHDVETVVKTLEGMNAT